MKLLVGYFLDFDCWFVYLLLVGLVVFHFSFWFWASFGMPFLFFFYKYLVI